MTLELTRDPCWAALGDALGAETAGFELANALGGANDLPIDSADRIAGISRHFDIRESRGLQPDEAPLSLRKLGNLPELLTKLEALGRAGGPRRNLKLAERLGRCFERQLAAFAPAQLPSVSYGSSREPTEDRVAVDPIAVIDELSPSVMTCILDQLGRGMNLDTHRMLEACG